MQDKLKMDDKIIVWNVDENRKSGITDKFKRRFARYDQDGGVLVWADAMSSWCGYKDEDGDWFRGDWTEQWDYYRLPTEKELEG